MKRIPAYVRSGTGAGSDSVQPLEQVVGTAIYDPVEKCYYVAETENERLLASATHTANLATYRTATAPASNSGYTVIAYYYPGWKDNSDLKANMALGDARWNTPWVFGNGYNREPGIGRYTEGEQYVMDNQIIQASTIGGVDVFAFCWFRKDNATVGAHALNKFKTSPEKARMKFCILWDVQAFPLASQQHFLDAIAEMQTHFSDPQYYKIGGRPVVMIQPLANFAAKMESIGYGVGQAPSCTAALAAARAHGTAANIYFVALAQTSNHWFNGVAGPAGFDAITAYNYHQRTINRDTGASGPTPSTYQQLLDNVLQPEWSWACQVPPANVKYWPIVMHGWDSRPWGGAQIGIATLPEWEDCLTRVKTIVDTYATKTEKIICINAWNEWHEGSFIEPSQQYGCAYLRAIKAKFK